AHTLAVLGHEEDNSLYGVRGARKTHGLAVEDDLAAFRPIHAEQGARKFGSARADEAGEAENLAAMQLEVHFLERMAPGLEVSHRQLNVAPLGGGRRVRDLQVAAHHEANHVVMRDRLTFEVPHEMTIAQDDDAIACPDDLMQAVGDENDGDALRLQPRNH